MGFVNEYISEENIKKYHIADIDRQFFNSSFKPQWTIDKDKQVYLRLVGSGREEFATHKTFSFYWQDALHVLRLEQRVLHSQDGSSSLHYEILNNPQEAAGHPTMLSLLKEALEVYQGGGVHSGPTRTVTFGF